MKKNNTANIKILNNGENVSDSKKNLNEKESKKKIIFIYIIPLIALVALGFIYIFTHINILLIPFAFLLFGWDGATRVCPNCKIWNSVVWIKSENISETEEKSENISETEEIKTKKKKQKSNKKVKIKYTINQGKCKECGCVFERKKQRLF